MVFMYNSTTYMNTTNDSNHFYLTVGIPYVNGRPHLGHVLEWFQADAIARYAKQRGQQVEFTAGADENSLKNVQAAEKNGIDVQAYLDEYSSIFRQAYEFFDIGITNFQRGSDKTTHWPGVQKLWQLCAANGDIYQKEYTGLYCVGCEAFYSEAELTDGLCPEHLTKPEVINEKNYFFRLSKYQTKLRQLIASDELLIISDQYKQEMLGFIDTGLEDFSISRSTNRARGVGVPVPNDSDQVIYVWFDALNIYMTAIGWGTNEENWQKVWPADVHIIGKGIARFHAIYWIAMLLSAQLPLPKAISVHGYINVDGQKMSKSLGNVLDPFTLSDELGLENLRYYLIKEVPSHADGDFSKTKFAETYTADLANGIGNLSSRIAKLASGLEKPVTALLPSDFDTEYTSYMAEFSPDKAAKYAMQLVRDADLFLSTEKPWLLSGVEKASVVQQATNKLLHATYHLQPMLPYSAEKIINHFKNQPQQPIQPLFPRLG